MMREFDEFQRRRKALPFNESTYNLTHMKHDTKSWNHYQRATVKINYRTPQYLSKHLNYLLREGASQNQQLFNESREVSKNIFLKKLQNEKRHFRIILSPENAHKMDMKNYTRQTIKVWEQRLGYKLNWVAITHTNTDNIHTHIIIRGIDKQKLQVKLPKNFIKYEARVGASKVASAILGFRSHEEALQLQSLNSERFTLYDKQLSLMKKIHYKKLDTYLKKRVNTLEKLNYAHVTFSGKVIIVPNLRLAMYKKSQIKNKEITREGLE